LITVHDVLYVPDLGANLVSIQQLCRKNFEVLFQASKATVMLNGVSQAIAPLKDNLYYLTYQHDAEAVHLNSDMKDQNGIDNSKGDQMLWHRRFAHTNHQYLAGMHEMVKGLPKLKSSLDDPCEGCIQGKMTRAPFKKSTNQTKRPLEKVYMDFCGPFQTQSLGGSYYTMLCTDEYTRFRESYFLKNKTEAFRFFKLYHVSSERHFNGKYKLGSTRTDGGGEFSSNEFKAYCEDCGIKQEFTAPYTPQQEGTSEVSNRIVIGRANAIMIEAEAPQYLWAEAVQTTTILTNLVPNKGNKAPNTPYTETPYEMWYGYKPSVTHLRRWGSLSYIHLNTKLREGKIGHSRALRCVFIGYTESTTKLWRFYDPKTRRIHVSRDAVILENMLWKSSKDIDEATESKLIEAPNWRYIDDMDNTTEDTDLDLEPGQSEPDSEIVLDVPKKDKPKRMLSQLKIDGNFPEADTSSLRQTRTRSHDQAKLAEDVCTELGEDVCFMVQDGPKSVSAALKGPDAKKWKLAIQEEIENLEDHHTWNVTRDLPKNTRPITSRMVLQKKIDANGNIVKYKARLVAHGFKQRPGQDFTVAYAPLISMITVRLMLTKAAIEGLEIDQMDVVGAFLEAPMKPTEQIYMKLPNGFVNRGGKIQLDDVQFEEEIIVQIV
jgi:hypothetical protein